MLTKADILARLQKEVLSLQGYKPASADNTVDFGLGQISHSFANSTFPAAALHEFCCNTHEEVSTSGAFIAGLLSPMMRKDGVSFWISTKRRLFPPALQSFGISPDQIIFIDLKKPKEVVWTVEEALRCTTLTTVIGEIDELDFTESRRLQLAIEKSGVGCFLLRHKPRNLATAATSRWHIKPLSSQQENLLPGVGHPRWQVNLLKIRNGKPGSWELEWMDGCFRHPSKLSILHGTLQKKVG